MVACKVMNKADIFWQLWLVWLSILDVSENQLTCRRPLCTLWNFLWVYNYFRMKVWKKKTRRRMYNMGAFLICCWVKERDTKSQCSVIPLHVDSGREVTTKSSLPVLWRTKCPQQSIKLFIVSVVILSPLPIATF